MPDTNESAYKVKCSCGKYFVYNSDQKVCNQCDPNWNKKKVEDNNADN